MFSYERYLSVLKGYVRNRAHPEGSIIEGYTTEEVIEFCADYVKDGKRIGLPVPLHEGKLSGIGRVGRNTFIAEDYKIVQEAHFSVLQQLAIAEPYVMEHLSELLEKTKVAKKTRS